MTGLSPPSIYIASTSSNLLSFPIRLYTHLRFFPPSLHLSLPHTSLPLPVFPFFSNIYKSLNTSLTYSSILLIASAVFPFTILLFFCRPFHSYFPSSFFFSPPCPPLSYISSFRYTNFSFTDALSLCFLRLFAFLLFSSPFHFHCVFLSPSFIHFSQLERLFLLFPLCSVSLFFTIIRLLLTSIYSFSYISSSCLVLVSGLQFHFLLFNFSFT